MTKQEAAAKIMSRQRVVGRYCRARHPRTVDNGFHVIGATYNNEAVCLWYPSHHSDEVDRDVLIAMFVEAKELGLATPIHVYGRCCAIVGDDRSFVFHQIDY